MCAQLAGIKASAVSVEEAQAYAAAAPGAAVLVGNGRANCASLRAGLNARGVTAFYHAVLGQRISDLCLERNGILRALQRAAH